MERGLITEVERGVFETKVRCTAAELPGLLAMFDETVAAATPAVTTPKPPPIVLGMQGVDAHKAMDPTTATRAQRDDLVAIAHCATFQRFIESHKPLPDDSDSVGHAFAALLQADDLAALLREYKAWHAARWPEESPFPAGIAVPE